MIYIQHRYVVSKGRPKNVPAIHQLFPCGYTPTWVVGIGETAAYKAMGAVRVVEGGGLCASRNKCIELAKCAGKYCVEMSDDIYRMAIVHYPLGEWIRPPKLSEASRMVRMCTEITVSPLDAARYIEMQMRYTKSHLGGVYCTKNVPQGVACPPVQTYLFVIGDFMVIDPNSKPRFDEKMSLKEDYDFTAAHLKEYGVVARSNRVFCLAKHYVNAGGAVADRTSSREQYNIAVLRHKWPGVFHQHATRGKNEVTMKWKCRHISLGGRLDPEEKKVKKGYHMKRVKGYNAPLSVSKSGMKKKKRKLEDGLIEKK